jgi:hypothetical protein
MACSRPSAGSWHPAAPSCTPRGPVFSAGSAVQWLRDGPCRSPRRGRRALAASVADTGGVTRARVHGARGPALGSQRARHDRGCARQGLASWRGPRSSRSRCRSRTCSGPWPRTPGAAGRAGVDGGAANDLLTSSGRHPQRAVERPRSPRRPSGGLLGLASAGRPRGHRRQLGPRPPVRAAMSADRRSMLHDCTRGRPIRGWIEPELSVRDSNRAGCGE